MSAKEIIEQWDKLPVQEQEEVFASLAQKIVHRHSPDARRWVGKRLSFEEACDVVFRENRQLLAHEVLQIHSRSLAEHGGMDGVRDPGLVESALASAKNVFYYGRGDLFDVAAAYVPII